MSLKIQVTGFGPFHGYSVNPSELICSKLDEDHSVFRQNNIDLLVTKVPVEYEPVKSLVAEIWRGAADSGQRANEKQQFAVHIGVHSSWNKTSTNIVRIEKCGRNVPCFRADVGGRSLNCQCEPCGPEIVPCVLDLDAVAEHVNVTAGHKDRLLPVKVSHDAGEYLCNYIYYLSLRQGNGHALFIHVPDLPEGDEATRCSALSMLTETVKRVILCCAQQLRCHSG